jgi:hypothetical protein
MTPAAAWILSLMVLLAPPSKAETRVTYADAKETAAEALVRYGEIAEAIADVAYDPNEDPLFVRDGRARARTAATLLAVSFLESGLRRDVDLGLGRAGFGPTMDCGLWQMNIGNGRTAEGWSCFELLHDRRKAARSALHLLAKSLRACKDKPVQDRFASYCSGSCDHGLNESRARFAVAKRIYALGSRPAPDREWILPRQVAVIPALDFTTPCYARCGKLLGGAARSE